MMGIDWLYDHQSQASSTHRNPFGKRLKKMLRLNRDRGSKAFCLRQMNRYRDSEGRENQLQHMRYCCRGGWYCISSLRMKVCFEYFRLLETFPLFPFGIASYYTVLSSPPYTPLPDTPFSRQHFHNGTYGPASGTH